MIEEIQAKAEYCLNCKMKPCQNACPLGNDTAGFIKLVKEDKIKEAYELLLETTVLQPVCSRICPHDKQCQGSCVRGIKQVPVSIGDMEAYVGDMAIEKGWKINKKSESKDKKIAVLGVEVKLNKALGQDYTLEELFKEYDAVYLGFGANISSKMGIEGENLEGVLGGNELLENASHPDYTGKTVIVSGGGNVAMDTSRTVKRLGAKKVIVVYRRSRAEMPAEKKEIEEAMEEGVEFLFQNNIIKICGDKKVEKIECIKTKLVQKEGETRLSPVNIEGSNFFLLADYVIMAVGSKPEENLLAKLNLELDKKGRIKIDENNMTSQKGVFAGGDLAGTKATVAWASRSGRDAGNAIIKYLEKN